MTSTVPHLALHPDAARRIRDEIQRAGGREVCFLARVDAERRLVEPRAVARGNRGAVLAAARDAEAGEVLVHNHPSGLLDPSDADLVMAARLYEEGLGTAIVDNEARRLYVVVEPPLPRTRTPLEVAEVEAVLAPGGPLAGLHPGFEDRPGQRTMAGAVAKRFNEGGVLVVEAGTGTGKSLAYLLPSALWALRNGERTVISTNTINLQEQLVGKDLPLVRRLTDKALSWSLVKGRGNYVSIRRLLLAAESSPTLFETDRSAELEALVEWSRNTRDGSLSDLPVMPSSPVWEEVRSDSDICLKARCPHFQECFYQQARRRAAAADLLVVNHALLFSDLALREAMENWSQSAVLPPYRHVILDEGHNVEDAATSHLGTEVTRTGLFRTLSRLDRNGKGVLASVEGILERRGGGGEVPRILARIRDRVRPGVARARQALDAFFDALEPRVPQPGDEPLRLGRGDARDPSDSPEVLTRLDALTAAFARLGREVEDLRIRLEDDESLRDATQGRILDLGAMERRLESGRLGLGLVLDPGDEADTYVRWIEARGGDGDGRGNIRLAAAPVEPGRRLRKVLYEQVDTTVVASATLTVGRDGFGFIRDRLGLTDPAVTPAAGPGGGGRSGLGQRRDPAHDPTFPELALHDALPDALPVYQMDAGDEPEPLEIQETVVPSTFQYPEQALFAVPTDLPGTGAGSAFQEATARIVEDVTALTDGGVFVLFTSHHALRTVAGLLRRAGVNRSRPLLVHGEGPRHRLLADFAGSGRGILLGTSSFWEGVDVPGDPLRALILQKLPFRVPSEPITQARMEALEARGQSPFGQYLLPLAALRLKQGFGRLIRSRRDRGAVLLLDDRILTRGYGRVLRAGLPPAPLVKGPWAELRPRLEAFYRAE
ncbi:MAG: helicase [Gemmatimonadales bacterium]|nr:MAG: helicase [Gemmatimonadales bacterium]